MKFIGFLAFVTMVLLSRTAAYGQCDTAVYRLTIRQEQVNKTGKSVPGMTINGSTPGPTIRFREGGYAVIYVKNEMDVETSVHWHAACWCLIFTMAYLT